MMMMNDLCLSVQHGVFSSVLPTKSMYALVTKTSVEQSYS
jgi:hypothetical protein